MAGRRTATYCSFAYSGLQLAALPNGTVSVSVDVAAVAPAGLACREVTQVYLTLPPVPGLVTPIYSLVAFAVTQLPPAGAPPTRVSLLVGADDLKTTAVDGTRALTGGAYTFAVGGHLPDDEKGAAQSNALVGVVQL